MYKVKIIVQGQCKEPWLHAALTEYEKRLRGRMEIQWAYAESPEELTSLCLKEKFLIALAIQGEPLTSPALSKKWSKLGAKVAFAIGGPEGLPQEVLAKAHERWSLSPLTFTNQIVRLLLVEQLYRALEIERGSPYHK